MSDLWGKGNSAAALDREECFAHKRSIAAMRQRSKASYYLSENRTLGRSFPRQGMTLGPVAGEKDLIGRLRGTLRGSLDVPAFSALQCLLDRLRTTPAVRT